MRMVNLFGAFAIHNPESCPMNNVEAKKVFLEVKDKLEGNKAKYGVKSIEAFYMSVLEHEWMIIHQYPIAIKNHHTLTGGIGTDIFICGPSTDTITDFNVT
jgi:hypothetical protein